MNDPLQEALDTAARKLNELLNDRARLEQQRAGIDAEIVKWARAVDSLKVVCAGEDQGDPSDVELASYMHGKQTVKFTDGVRMVLKEHREGVTVPEIRLALLNLGFDFSKYKQQLTPIHNCLKRLEQQREVKPEKNGEGETGVIYKWVSPIERALEEQSRYYPVTGEGIINAALRLQAPLGPNHPSRKALDRFKEIRAARKRKEAPTIYENMAEMALREEGKKEKK
jgi:hypothetical protein